MAAYNGNFDAAKLLLDCGADVDTAALLSFDDDQTKRSPLSLTEERLPVRLELEADRSQVVVRDTHRVARAVVVVEQGPTGTIVVSGRRELERRETPWKANAIFGSAVAVGSYEHAACIDGVVGAPRRVRVAECVAASVV